MNKLSKIFKRILNNDLFTLLGILLVWRIFITVAGIIGLIMFAPLNMPAVDFSYGTFWDMWTRWDGWHYINISNNGYTDPQLSAFFPLYPMLIYGLSTALNLNPAIAGLLISHFALFGALYFAATRNIGVLWIKSFDNYHSLFSKKIQNAEKFYCLYDCDVISRIFSKHLGKYESLR